MVFAHMPSDTVARPFPGTVRLSLKASGSPDGGAFPLTTCQKYVKPASFFHASISSANQVSQLLNRNSEFRTFEFARKLPDYFRHGFGS